MKCSLPIVLAALALAGCGRSAPPAATPASSTAVAMSSPAAAASVPAPMAPDALARYDGYGDMRFGMDGVAFGKAWGGELNGAPDAGSTCFYKSPKWAKLPGDIRFMFEDGRFVRYDVGTAKEAAPGGGKVGMDEAQIRNLYGPVVQAQPHKYVTGAQYLRIAAAQGGVLLFETDEHGKVTRWRVGVPPQVDYVEGCS